MWLPMSRAGPSMGRCSIPRTSGEKYEVSSRIRPICLAMYSLSRWSEPRACSAAKRRARNRKGPLAWGGTRVAVDSPLLPPFGCIPSLTSPLSRRRPSPPRAERHHLPRSPARTRHRAMGNSALPPPVAMADDEGSGKGWVNTVTSSPAPTSVKGARWRGVSECMIDSGSLMRFGHEWRRSAAQLSGSLWMSP